MNGDLEAGIKTGVVDAQVTGSAGASGLQAGMDVSMSPQMGNVATGAAGAMAYNWVATMLGAWTAPALVVLGAGVWIYRKQKAKKAAP